MADISKCMGRNCERRETCYRYTAPENQYRWKTLSQSYAFFDDDPKKCEHYWPIEVRNLDRLDAAAELRRLAALSESNAIDALNYESRIERLQAENDALRAMHDAAPTVEAQPVAWMDDFGNAFPLAANKGAGSWLDEHKRNWKPLYTHPAAPQPAALPELSDAEILRIAESVPDKDPTLTQPASWGHGFRENADGEYMIPNILPYVTVAFARAVIAALKGKQ